MADEHSPKCRPDISGFSKTRVKGVERHLQSDNNFYVRKKTADSVFFNKIIIVSIAGLKIFFFSRSPIASLKAT